jgi:hypothetical protein
MPVLDNYYKITYLSDGIKKIYTFNWTILDKGDLNVYIIDLDNVIHNSNMMVGLQKQVESP